VLITQDTFNLEVILGYFNHRETVLVIVTMCSPISVIPLRRIPYGWKRIIFRMDEIKWTISIFCPEVSSINHTINLMCILQSNRFIWCLYHIGKTFTLNISLGRNVQVACSWP